MDAEEVLNLFDSFWFNLKISNDQPSSSSSEENPDIQQFQEEPSKDSKPILSRSQTRHTRSMSDQLISAASFDVPGSFSPDTVLVPKLQPILSGRETGGEDENPTETNIRKASPIKVKFAGGGRRRKGGVSKSLSDLEFDELKGFMDLGFVFSEEDKDSSLASIIPGLQRLGKKDEEKTDTVKESGVPRPYLSEAWQVFDKRKKQNPLTNWRVPAPSSEIDMKDNLRCWAHTVASSFR